MLHKTIIPRRGMLTKTMIYIAIGVILFIIIMIKGRSVLSSLT